MAQAIYSPDPDPELLSATDTARFSKQNGKSVIGFCIDTKGKVSDVSVCQAFPDDPAIDDILMDTVAEWRLKPFLVDGQPMKTCTYRTFNLAFKPKQ